MVASPSMRPSVSSSLQQREAIAADGDDIRGRPVTTSDLAHRVDAAGISGVDEAAVPDREMRQVGALDAAAGRSDAAPSGRAAPSVFVSVALNSATMTAPIHRRAARGPGRTGSAPAGRSIAAARGEQAGFAENRNVDERGVALGPQRTPRQAVPAHAMPRRPSSGLHARTSRSRRGGTRPRRAGSAWRQRSSRRCARKHVRIEGVMQSKRAAGEEPRHEREADAGKRSTAPWSRGCWRPAQAGFPARRSSRPPDIRDAGARPAPARLRRLET